MSDNVRGEADNHPPLLWLPESLLREVWLCQHLDQVACWVFEIDASAAVMVVDLPLLGLVWISPTRDFSSRKSFDDNIKKVVGE
nr:hypothetical protein [Rhodococcus sp. (in: high G+C Gram-positive bacteria)]